MNIIKITNTKNKIVVNKTDNTIKVIQRPNKIIVKNVGIQGPKGDSGEGIKSINSLEILDQFIVIGEDGNDVNIVSAVDTHTINIPTASATKRGALDSADYTNFNSKQDALGFTPENVANKATDFSTVDNTLYPSVQAVKTELDLKAPLESPAFTGIPTAPDADPNTGGNQVANLQYVDNLIDNLPLGTTGEMTNDDLLVVDINGAPKLFTPIQIEATTTTSGFMSSADKILLGNKVDKINITGDSLGSTSQTLSITYNDQGQITSASEQDIQITQSQVDNLTTDLGNKLSTTLADGKIFIGNASNLAQDQSISGEATITNTGNLTLDNGAVIGKVLTGLNVTGGTVVATDSILNAFGKVQNQINGLIGGSIYQGVWNATTNSPTLTSSVGTTGYYYIVNVAGSTNLNGITDWKIGDWAIFDGTVWQKVDNTDAVSSVNGYTGAVNLTTADIPDSTDKRYVSDAQLIVLGNTSGTNTGDNATNTTSNSYADGKVADAINDGITTIAPSQNAVFDALAGKVSDAGIVANNLVYADTNDSIIEFPNNPTSSLLFLGSANGALPSWQVIPTQGQLTYYFTNTTSSIATYYQQTVDPLVALNAIPNTGVVDGQLLTTFATNVNNPNLEFLPAGEYRAHIHAAKVAGTKDAYIRAEVWEVNAAGVDIAKVADLGPSVILTGVNAEYIIAHSNPKYIFASTSSRLITRIYAVIVGGGSAPDITLYVGDGSDSHIILPGPVADVTNFLPYTGAIRDTNTGVYTITSAGFIGSLTGNADTATTLSAILSLDKGGANADLSTFTTGSIIFKGASALAQDASNFIWDDTNNRLCIGTATSRQTITIGTQTATSTATPDCIDLGGTYSDTFGANLKLKIRSTAGTNWGIGASITGLQYVLTGGFAHHFVIAGVSILSMDSGGANALITTASTSSTTGGLKLAGGLGIALATDATSAINGGTITTAGGVGIGKKLFVGTSIQVGVNGGTAGSILLDGNGNTILAFSNNNSYRGSLAYSVAGGYMYMQNNTQDKFRLYDGVGGTLMLQPAAGFINIPTLTASTALALDGSKNIISVTNTGTGNNVLSANPTLTGTIIAAALTASGLITANAGLTIGGTAQVLNLNSITSNTIIYGSDGLGDPTFTTRSVGTKIVLYSLLTGSLVDYAIGMNGSYMWHSVPQNVSTNSFRWFGGTTRVASLDGTGNLNLAGNITILATANTLVLKQGANGKTGTFTANGVTAVTVNNTSITANSGIIFTLKTVGGTVGACPSIKTITASTGFTVTCTVGDTSVYNYHIIESAA